MDKKVYIITVNYNGWKDTIEFIQSVCNNVYSNFELIIVDNMSTNESFVEIEKWLSNSCHFGHNIYQYRRGEFDSVLSQNSYVTLIKNEKNGGYANGMNVGIKYAQKRTDMDFVWLLNNDIIIDKYALSELIEKYYVYENLNVKTGIIGSKLIYYQDPKNIQSVGCIYNKFTGLCTLLGLGLSKDHIFNEEELIKKMNYVSGASMFVSKKYLDEVGLMSEEYFMFYEDVEWCLRGTVQNWKLGLCLNSLVYHKEGCSTGTNLATCTKSFLSDYYGLLNRIKISAQYFKEFYLIRLFFILLSAIKKILLGRGKVVLMVLKKIIS